MTDVQRALLIAAMDAIITRLEESPNPNDIAFACLLSASQGFWHFGNAAEASDALFLLMERTHKQALMEINAPNN